MPEVYVGPIAALYEVYKDELKGESELLAALSSHAPQRAKSLGAGRALLKYALRHHCLLDQGALLPPLVLGRLGKPSLQWPQGSRGCGWDFNLSHSNGLLALTLGQGAMGIDLELCALKRLTPMLLNKILDPAERRICALLGATSYTASRGDPSVRAGWVTRGTSAGGVCAGGYLQQAEETPLTAEQLMVQMPNDEEAQELYSAAWQKLLCPKTLRPIQRQSIWWTQQWTLRECVLKILGQSIFAYDQLTLDVHNLSIKMEGLPQGTVHCVALRTQDYLDISSSVRAPAPCELAVTENEMQWVLSVFVPEGDSLQLKLWNGQNWSNFAGSALCTYHSGAHVA